MQDIYRSVIYEEVEKRRELLGRLHALIQNDPLRAQRLYTEVTAERLLQLGKELGFDTAESIQRFTSLVDEGYIQLRPYDRGLYDPTDQTPFRKAALTRLTDKGLREINILPPAESIEGILESLRQLRTAIENDPGLDPAERDRKAQVLESASNGLVAAVHEFGARAIAEVIWHSFSPG
jgi:hypothetical protein